MIKTLWKLCISSKNETEPLYSLQENDYFSSIYDDDLVDITELSEFSINQRVDNMCYRWKIKRQDALYLINMVDTQQNSN